MLKNFVEAGKKVILSYKRETVLKIENVEEAAWVRSFLPPFEHGSPIDMEY